MHQRASTTVEKGKQKDGAQLVSSGYWCSVLWSQVFAQPKSNIRQPFVSTSSAEREELPEVSQGSSTSAGIIIRMTYIALLVQNTLLGHFRLPLDMILLPFQSLNICPLLPVTLAQFNWAVTYILSWKKFCSQVKWNSKSKHADKLQQPNLQNIDWDTNHSFLLLLQPDQ